jgi:carboxyl-terminal processing protease
VSSLRLSPPPAAPRSGNAPFVLGLACGLLFALAIERTVRGFLDRDMELVRTVRDLALEDFVTEVESDRLVDDALNGMLEGLDDFSHYYRPEEIPGLERETSGEFLGIGVVFRAGEPGRILFAYPGSPAAAAGLGVGDRIVRANGQPLAGLGAEDLQGILHGGARELRLEIEDLRGETREAVVRPDVVLDPTVRHARLHDEERGIGYLAIRSFSNRTPEEFDGAVARLHERGLRALVVDLRANPGGTLEAAVSLANRFVVSGAIVATRERDATRVTDADPERATLRDLPLVVLLDGYSASASEVLAAALQDHAVAAIVGEPSYGKGTVQTLKRIGGDRAIVKLTTAHYCSPSLRRIEHFDDDGEQSGIAPDLWLPLSASERTEIHRFLAGYSPPEEALADLRAWEVREHVRLVESPPADRQLDAAVALLAGDEIELRGDPLP